MKTAVVTGASGSMGSKLVEALKKDGVVCITLVKSKVDFRDQRSLIDTVNKISKKYKKIDYLFHVAGVGIYKKIENLSISEWKDSIDINLNAPFILTKTLLPLLKKSTDPLVLSFGSGMGVIPVKNRVAYCTSKFGLRGLSLTLSKEFKNRKVDFVLLTLGSVMTKFGPGGLERRKKLAKKGKKYLEVEEVIEKIMEIIKSKSRKEEYRIYPRGYVSESREK